MTVPLVKAWSPRPCVVHITPDVEFLAEIGAAARNPAGPTPGGDLWDTFCSYMRGGRPVTSYRREDGAHVIHRDRSNRSRQP